MKAQIGFMALFLIGTFAQYDDDAFVKVVRKEMCKLGCKLDNECPKNCDENRKYIVVLSNEETEANAALFCRDYQHIVLRRNPGPFVFELRLVGSKTWGESFVNLEPLLYLGRLQRGNQYELRVHRILSNGVSKPEIIGPFQTLPMDPDGVMKVDNISMSKFEEDVKHPDHLKLEMSFSRTKELNCKYEAVLWDPHNSNLQFTFDHTHELRMTFDNLKYGSFYTFEVWPVTPNDSDKTLKNFTTPNRLDIAKNPTPKVSEEIVSGTGAPTNWSVLEALSNGTGGGSTFYGPINVVFILFLVDLLQFYF